MLNLFRNTNASCAKIVTKNYSTSFSMGILAFDKKFRRPIYNIYGFVRYADEIVDTFFEYDQKILFEEFKADTYKAIERGISLNPILDAFQETVNTYKIDLKLIDAFLYSMEMDLDKSAHDQKSYEDYIYGSAEVVGLMCLRVFCANNDALYNKLVEPARRLGAAFQKVNFIRDLQDDFDSRGRTYFPGLELGKYFDNNSKLIIETDIEADFLAAYQGLLQLPEGCRLGVLTAYRFYWNLFEKIKRAQPQQILSKRFRVSNFEKLTLVATVFVKNRFNML